MYEMNDATALLILDLTTAITDLLKGYESEQDALALAYRARAIVTDPALDEDVES